MVLIAMDGFDNNHFGPGFTFDGSTSTGFTAGRTSGSSAAHIANGRIKYTNPGGGLVSGYCGFSFFTNVEKFVRLYGNTTTEQLWVQYTGGVLSCGAGATTLASVTIPLTLTAWNHISLQWTIDDTAGVFKVWINGVLIFDLSGVDTKQGAVVDINAVALSTNVGSGSSMDDFYFGDLTGPAPYNAPFGDCIIKTLRPSGPGDSSGWVGSDTNSTDNWALIDDTATTTDYIGAGSPGALDLSTFTDLPAGLGDVLAVRRELLVAKSDAGTPAGDLVIVTKVAGTSEDSSSVPASVLTTSYAWFTESLDTTTPAGSAWSEAAIADLQVGVRIS